MSFAKQQAVLPLALTILSVLSFVFTSPATAAPVPVRKATLTSAQRQALLRRQSAHTAGKRHAMVQAALRQRGTPYVWGGASRGGFDCSGLIRYLFKTQRGITLPHSASAQARRGLRVPFNQLKPGDLLFFSTFRRGISHVGVFIGSGKFVHAANRRKGVRVDRLTGYYARRFKAARRI